MSFTAKVKADISNFEKNLSEAQKSIDNFAQKVGNQLDKVGDSFTKAGKKVSILSAALVAAGTKSFLMAADIEDAVGATEQIFKKNANSVNAWAGNLDTSFGIAKKEALEYSNLMGSMLINIGKLTEEQAGKQSAKLIELAGDLTAMYGGSTQDAVRALTGALKGNNTMLDNYGMAVNEALIKQKALELGLMGTSGEMTLQAKQGATLALIWEQTGAAQGQAAREADTASGAMRAFRTEITNLSTELGEVLLPIITPIVAGIRDFVSGIRDLSPEVKKMIVVVAGITAAIGPLLLGLGAIIKILPLIGAGFTAITGPIGIAIAALSAYAIAVVNNWDEIRKTLAAMTNYIGAFFRLTGKSKVADTMQRWTEALTPAIEYTVTLTEEQEKFNEAMEESAKASAELIESLNTLGETKVIPKGSLNALTEELKGLYDELNNATTESARLKIAELIKVVEIQIARINASVDRRKSEIGRDVGPQLDRIDSSGVTDEDIWNVDDATLIDKAKATFDGVQEQLGAFGENVNTFSGDIAGRIGSTIENLAMGLANSLAGAIASGDNIIGVLASTLLNGLGNLAIEIGVITLGIGEAITAIFTSLINPLGTIGAGLALIALGVGLKAVAGAIGSKSGGAGVSQGGYSSGPGAKIADPTANFPRGEFQLAGPYSEEVEFKISGDSLVGILSKKENKANRLN